MVDKLNQQISQFLDDDLSYQESLSLLDAMKMQPDLLQKLHRYNTISHALKSDAVVSISPDFTERVRQSLQAEPVYLMPRRKPSVKRYAAASALAASVAIVAIMTMRSPDSLKPLQPPIAQSNPITLAAAPNISEPKPTVASQESEQKIKRTRFIEYLRAHNSSRYIDGSMAMQPYARIVSYQQE
ncbi:MAG: hypothetical protein Kow0065_20990 [Methylomicrobium sp.]